LSINKINHQYQKTIVQKTQINGIGLHTGLKTSAILRPAQPNHGIKFQRIDLKNKPIIPADIKYIYELNRGTSLKKNNVLVYTVEHLLSAIIGLEIDNILIQLTAKEVPIIDGSAMPFVEIITKCGIKKQNKLKNTLIIKEPLSFTDSERNVDIHVIPSKTFKITFITDYNMQSSGKQIYSIDDIHKNYVRDIAPARTFCLLSELINLKSKGLIKGGNLNNAVVFIDYNIKTNELIKLQKIFNINQKLYKGDNNILNGKQLKYKEEHVRHKILDLIGDLALIGRPLIGHIIAIKSGHASNIELVKLIKRNSTKMVKAKNIYKTKKIAFDIQKLLKVMPHRYPFLLIDRILSIVPGKVVNAIKNVTINEPFFQGHFPGQPVMPGVLILESMAQAGGFLILNSIKNPETKLMYFSAINKSRFKKTVEPGDQVCLEVKLDKFKLNTCKIFGVAKVDDEIVAEAEMMASIVDRRI
tara:strand:- start:1495 stop:2907 length:1413 start_codon:yes stop_codon:yes gene_type:complete